MGCSRSHCLPIPSKGSPTRRPPRRRAIEEFRDKRYILSVSPAPEVHVMLTHEATADDVTEAVFLGHTVLHRLEREVRG